MKTLMLNSISTSIQSFATVGGSYWPTLVQATPSMAKCNDAHFNRSIEGSTEVHEGCSVT
jgi:hypothetical protein